MGSSWHKNFWAVLPHLLLIAAAFILYAESFGHPWAMDDHVVLVQNLDIRSWAGFLEDHYPGRPLREFTYLLDYKMFGLNPTGYHVQNILWHGVNASLLVVVVRTLGGGLPVAWLAGVLFLVHPLNVEVVTNISHRKDSLMLFFMQLSLLAALRFYQKSHLKVKSLWGGLGVLSFGVACLAKQSAVGLLPLLLGYELTMSDRRDQFFLRNRRLVGLGIVGLIGVAIFWYASAWQGERFQSSLVEIMVRLKVYSGFTIEIYLLTIFKSLAFMFLRLVWPFALAMEYVYSVPQGWLDPWVCGGLSLLLVSAACMFLCRKSLPLVTVGIAWMLAFWLPVSNLLWPLSYFAADRYMYAPCAGFALLVAVLAEKYLSKHKSVFYGFCVPLVLALSFLTWQQNRVWKDDIHLFQQALKVSPSSTRALMGMGVAQMNAGQFELAKQYLEKAAVDFNDSKTLHLLGQVHEKLGNHRKALRYYQRFVMMNEPKYHQEVQSLKKHLKMQYGRSF